jgi:hypothetical protein
MNQKIENLKISIIKNQKPNMLRYGSAPDFVRLLGYQAEILLALLLVAPWQTPRAQPAKIRQPSLQLLYRTEFLPYCLINELNQ